MARGPDGKGGGAGFSLADQLFNAQSIGDLARDYAVLGGFDASKFQSDALGGMEGRGLLERLDWIADCIQGQLPQDFGQMADALQRAMPAPLDPDLTDDDFGRFIHAVPGILAVRHGLEDHRERALDLIYEATKRFSMEFYIRPFLNRWPEETLARLEGWAKDPNYHVRRLVSEGTRPKLPWAKNIDLDPAVPLRFLEQLHADPTRYVTRSVANHMNDLSKIMPDEVVARLSDWQGQERQQAKEMDWITRHALRTAVKRGERGALDLLGYSAGDVTAKLSLPDSVKIGEAVQIEVALSAPQDLPVMVDYRLRFARPTGTAEKVFKLKTGKVKAGQELRLSKAHKLKGDASTFKLHPGRHGITVQVNGLDVAEGVFEVLPES
jgi:3-methyladenine DNA glycosylase AlkC